MKTTTQSIAPESNNQYVYLLLIVTVTSTIAIPALIVIFILYAVKDYNIFNDFEKSDESLPIKPADPLPYSRVTDAIIQAKEKMEKFDDV